MVDAGDRKTRSMDPDAMDEDDEQGGGPQVQCAKYVITKLQECPAIDLLTLLPFFQPITTSSASTPSHYSPVASCSLPPTFSLAPSFVVGSVIEFPHPQHLGVSRRVEQRGIRMGRERSARVAQASSIEDALVMPLRMR